MNCLSLSPTTNQQLILTKQSILTKQLIRAQVPESIDHKFKQLSLRNYTSLKTFESYAKPLIRCMLATYFITFSSNRN